jgi:hypothetical protein
MYQPAEKLGELGYDDIEFETKEKLLKEKL